MVRKFFPEPPHHIDEFVNDRADADNDDDAPPTLTLHCAVCGNAWAACACQAGPTGLLLPFQQIAEGDRDWMERCRRGRHEWYVNAKTVYCRQCGQRAGNGRA